MMNGEKTHDELTFEVLDKIRLKEKKMVERREKEKNYWNKLTYECEKALAYNVGFIDILVTDDGGSKIIEIKTKQEILGSTNFCGDTLRQLNKYKKSLKDDKSKS
ncbi:hypothetical protein LCGC14_2340770, partial [marine sediment metagenome]